MCIVEHEIVEVDSDFVFHTFSYFMTAMED